MNASSSILAAFATIGMMYAARLAGMDWQFTLLVGCCIGLAALQGLQHKAEEEEKERHRKAIAAATRASLVEASDARSRKGKKKR